MLQILWPGPRLRAARRFHLLKPEYLVGRVRELQRAFRLRVVLVHVDVDDPVAALGDVTALTLRSDCTLVCAWSYEVRPGLALLRTAAPGFFRREELAVAAQDLDGPGR